MHWEGGQLFGEELKIERRVWNMRGRVKRGKKVPQRVISVASISLYKDLDSRG